MTYPSWVWLSDVDGDGHKEMVWRWERFQGHHSAKRLPPSIVVAQWIRGRFRWQQADVYLPEPQYEGVFLNSVNRTQYLAFAKKEQWKRQEIPRLRPPKAGVRWHGEIWRLGTGKTALNPRNWKRVCTLPGAPIAVEDFNKDGRIEMLLRVGDIPPVPGQAPRVPANSVGFAQFDGKRARSSVWDLSDQRDSKAMMVPINAFEMGFSPEPAHWFVLREDRKTVFIVWNQGVIERIRW